MKGRELEAVYALASNGDPEAFAWLVAWHGWCHRIDDHIDEADHPHSVVDLCADGIVLTSCPFYRRHAESLGPVIAIVFEQYRVSLGAERILADALRICANQVVLLVAYLKGGRSLVEEVAKRLFPIVVRTQLATP